MPSAGSTILARVMLSTSTWRRTSRTALRLAVAPEDLQVDARPLGPLKPVGRLVEAEPLDRLAGDLDDPVAADEPGLPRRPAADHADQPQALGSLFSSMPRPTKLPSIMA